MRRPHRPAWFVIACLGAALPSAHARVASLPLSCHVHKTVAGDTLADLARLHLARPSDWRSLARLNKVRDPRRLAVGTLLCLPVDWLKSKALAGVVLDVSGDVLLQAPAAGTPGTAGSPPEAKSLRAGPSARALGARPPSPARIGTGQTTATHPPPEAMAPVHPGDAVPPGARLRTGANGYVTVQLPDGSTLKIQADTDASLVQSRQYESAGFFSTIWRMLKGRVESHVPAAKDGQPRHQIQTPPATIGVRGTTYRVSTDGMRTTDETLSGTVAVVSGKTERLVRAGEGTIAQQGRAPQAPQPLPAAPDVSRLPALHERVLLKFALPEVPGARVYRIQVAEDEAFERIRGEARSDTPMLRLKDLPDGDYFLRARVAGGNGLEGADAIKPFRLNARPEAPIPLGPPHQGKVRAASVTLSWTAHPDAVHYRLQIARDDGFQQLVHDIARLTDTQASFEMPPGDYHWRTASTGQDANGLDPGPWGDDQLLRMREPPPDPPPPRIADTTLSFQLQAEPGQRFELQLARDAAFTQLIEEIRSDSSLVTVRRPEEGGLIHVRYRAIDDDGFVGPYSTSQRVALPPCVRSGSGQCVQGGTGYLISSP